MANAISKPLPKHLSQHEAQGLALNEPIAQFEIGKMQNFVYLILDWDQKKAAIVDPQEDLSKPLGALKSHGFELESILLTHTHYDHIAGVPQLAKDFQNLKIYVNHKDFHRLSTIEFHSNQIQEVSDEDTIRVGSLELKTLHTPGHSAGEISYFLQEGKGNAYLFTGDTVFIRDCGRTDFETGNNQEMFQSLQRIKKLPGEVIILPGHHYQKECASRLAKEMAESPPFQCRSVEELMALP